MKLSVQLVNPGGQLFVRPCDRRIRDDVADGQRPHPGSRYAQHRQPTTQLRAGAGIDDAPESDPAMGRRTHGAMLARGIYRGSGSVLGAHVLRRPAGNGELRMLGMITPGKPVAILEQHLSLRRHQHRTEGLIASGQCFCRQFNASLQVLAILLTDHGISPSDVAGPLRVQCGGAGRSIAAGARWIPKGMTIENLAPFVDGDTCATSTPYRQPQRRTRPLSDLMQTGLAGSM